MLSATCSSFRCYVTPTTEDLPLAFVNVASPIVNTTKRPPGCIALVSNCPTSLESRNKEQTTPVIHTSRELSGSGCSLLFAVASQGAGQWLC